MSKYTKIYRTHEKQKPKRIQVSVEKNQPVFRDNIIEASKRFLKSSSKGLAKVQKTWFSKKNRQSVKRNLIFGVLMLKRYSKLYFRKLRFWLHLKTMPKNVHKAFREKLTILETENKTLQQENKKLKHFYEAISKALKTAHPDD